MRALKTGVLLIALAAVFAGCDKANQTKFEKAALVQVLPDPIFYDDNCGGLYETKLIAGQHIEAGLVRVWVEGDYLMVKYIANEGNLISETHLAVENNADAIPHNQSGNPKIGNFEYNGVHDPMMAEVTYKIDIDEAQLEGVVSIAAHAVVMIASERETCLSVAGLEALIPEGPVTIDAIPHTMVNSFYDLTLSDAGEFSGTHLAWCIDNNGMPVRIGDAWLVSSYASSGLNGVVDNPANLDLLNYLMNHYYPETSFDVLQAAIWGIMNGMPYANGSGGVWLQGTEFAEYKSIVAEVLANGEGYVPAPGEYLVVIVNYGNIEELQNVFFLYKKCTYEYKEETAWGQGNPLTEMDIPFTPEGGSWATYFGYCTGK